MGGIQKIIITKIEKVGNRKEEIDKIQKKNNWDHLSCLEIVFVSSSREEFFFFFDLFNRKRGLY